jgi:L-2-hydroxyglutarate oxidase LhgO
VDRVDVIVVGAGVVGLAIAERVSRRHRDIVIVERLDSYGRQTSSRNSEVIHAGLYYEPGSLKAKLCIEGNRLIQETCARHGIPIQKPGKIVPGILPDEIERVHTVLDLAAGSGAEGVRLLSRTEVSELEPSLVCTEALFSAETGIVDTHRLMTFWEEQAGSRGATFAYGCELVGFEATSGPLVVEVREPDGRVTALGADWVVNSAGLSADRVAEAAGIDVDKAGYRQLYSKGEYFAVGPSLKGAVSHLIYPARTSRTFGTLCHGVHLVLDQGGRIKLGPNELYVDEISYEVADDHSDAFHGEMSRFLPWLQPEDLSPDMAGVRPMLQEEGGPFRDFVIREESDKGLPGLVNLLGIESPGLTSSPAIAALVDGMIG